jgi:hypothetical protein
MPFPKRGARGLFSKAVKSQVSEAKPETPGLNQLVAAGSSFTARSGRGVGRLSHIAAPDTPN